MNKKHYNPWLVIWLFSGCFLVFLMVVIGGITRITGSGLSIVEWNVISGAIPPLSQEEWMVVFEKYKQFPQYKKINYGMNLQEFKYIFFWEYLHRFIGRFIGIVFIVPFLIFYFKGLLNNTLKKRLCLIFVLGGLQGFVGWFMVKSGLVDNPNVSHYRLAMHLFLALGLLLFIMVTALKEMKISYINVSRTSVRYLYGIYVLLIIQIFYGALTAGLKAGYAYNTFPMMNGEWIPSGIMAFSPSWLNLFDNGITVQFIHRMLAVLLLILVISLLWRSFKENASFRKWSYTLFGCVMVQFTFGVITLLLHVPVFMGVVHQAMAVILLIVATIFLFRTNRIMNKTGEEMKINYSAMN